MTRRMIAALVVSSALFFACDQNSTSPEKTANTPAMLVGSWVTETGAYTYAHMVLRADGTGKSIGEAGSRREIYDITWRLEDSVLIMTRDTNHQTIPIQMHGDTLAFVVPNDYDILFVREAEPSLVASPGTKPAEMTGRWRRLIPNVSGHSSGNDIWYDTTWTEDIFTLEATGVATEVGPGVRSVCDSAEPGETPFCRLEEVPDDTTVYEWWTGNEKLFLQLISTGLLPVSVNAAKSVQVLDWTLEGDSLEIKALYYPFNSMRFGKVH